jgi:predicted nuclease of predicted toxin-antitoxin system
MRLLADQDIWKLTLDLLRDWGHDVITAKAIGLARGDDKELLAVAKKEQRILITRDKDFGSLVFLGQIPSPGVIFLRIKPESIDKVHSELQRLLSEHNMRELRSCFCTVEPGRHRIRKVNR